MTVKQPSRSMGASPMPGDLGIGKTPMLRAPILCALIFAVCPSARAATPQQVDDMLVKAKAFLYSKQHDSHWEVANKPEPDNEFYSPGSGQWGGLTSLTVYALLAAGESPQDAKL